MLLLQACGQNEAAEGRGESFAVAAEAFNKADEPAEAQASAAPQASAEIPQVSAGASSAVESSPAAQDVKVISESAIAVAPTGVPPEEAAAGDSSIVTPKPSSKAPEASSKAVAAQEPSKTAADSVTNRSAAPSSVPGKQPASGPSAEAGDTGKAPATREPVSASPTPQASPAQPAKVAAALAASPAGNTDIDWNGFFDGDDQTRPSEQFWDLSGSRVKIKGFMGEVLSFEKNWFLLIPEPGAECPFDNGDETYWNKIMIVFVPEGSKLRHTSGPLEISGRLDVGIKIDESGYKTMFRLYDASFKSL